MKKKGKKKEKQCQERCPNLGVPGGGPAPNRQALSGGRVQRNLSCRTVQHQPNSHPSMG